MEFILIDQQHDLWGKLISYTKQCSWETADYLSELMQQNKFSDWERILVAKQEETIIGFCTLTRKDTYPKLPYGPFIGFVFVSEEYRGNRVSEQLLEEGCDYLKNNGFETVYVVSGHDGLYEKFGFAKIDTLEQVNEEGWVFSKSV